MKTLSACTAILVLAASGCSGTTRTASYASWERGFRAAGYAANLPATEDLRVGDVLIYPSDPDAPGASMSWMRWSSIPLVAQLDAEYRVRPEWPATPLEYFRVEPDPSTRTWDEPLHEAPDGSIFASDAATRRLRAVGIHAISATTFSGEVVDALIPTPAMNLVAGAAFGDAKFASVRISDAEGYSLALATLLPQVLEIDDEGHRILRAPFRSELALLAPSSGRAWLRVVSEVVYMRSVDIAIEAATRSHPDDPTVPAAVDPDLVDSSGAVPIDERLAPFLRAGAINEAMEASDVDGLPGGLLRFISVTDESVTMRRTFRRGLAFALRGVTLEVDATTGRVLSLRLVGDVR